MKVVSTRRVARTLALLAVVSGVSAVRPAGAQAIRKQFSVTTRLGVSTPERAASLDRAALIGLDTEYALTDWFGLGTAIDVTRGNTTRADFLTRLRFGNATVAGGDSIRYQFVGQPVNTINLGLMGTLRYPSAKISPFLMGGVGTYVMLLDAQINGRETRKNDISYTGGAGVWYRLSERAGLQFDVRAISFSGYDRNFLNPAAGRAELDQPFPEDFVSPPAAKKTALNTTFTLGFRYIPGGTSGGN